MKHRPNPSTTISSELVAQSLVGAKQRGPGNLATGSPVLSNLGTNEPGSDNISTVHFASTENCTAKSPGINILCRLERKPKPRNGYEVPCDQCGVKLLRRKSYPQGIKSYCSRACYYAAIHNPNYRRDNLNGNYEARRVARRYFRLAKGNVVHHHDGDCLNNSIQNLAVFASQADHMSFHRGGKAQPIWDGRNVILSEVLHG